ncbi:Dyp-type peroxidase domain-containing protein [Helicobacter sp. UBA3407]
MTITFGAGASSFDKLGLKVARPKALQGFATFP